MKRGNRKANLKKTKNAKKEATNFRSKINESEKMIAAGENPLAK